MVIFVREYLFRFFKFVKFILVMSEMIKRYNNFIENNFVISVIFFLLGVV